MTPEEAYEEALRRIRKAEETGAVELVFRGLALPRLPPELASLTSLQSLDLSKCEQLSDDLYLSPLAGALRRLAIRSLQINLPEQLSSDLSPLAGLISLRKLDLSSCSS